MILKIIKKKLKKKIHIEYIQIKNISFKHKILNNKNSHFQIIIISKDFLKINILRRHQIIYNILSYEMKNIIHGIQLFTYSNDEWKNKKNKVSPSKCLNFIRNKIV